MKEKRKEVLARRKNFLPAFLATILLWLITLATLYFVDPQTFGVIWLFFILVFLALLFTFSLILESSRRGIIASLGIIIFVILRYFGIGNILNLIFIFALGATVEYYFLRRS